MRSFPLIIPTTEADFNRIDRKLDAFFEFLPIRCIIFIGADELKSCVKLVAEKYEKKENIVFLNENEIIPYEDIKQTIKTRLEKEGYGVAENSKPGWYYQQFLKMEYSRICDEEYYISWDADTIPLRKISMFHDSVPYLDIKPEYHSGYFRTIENLFGYGKKIEKSFVAEHMLFRADRMKEMIAQIEGTEYAGKRFYEKIFNAIDLDNMKRGFSEFETYGTWIMTKYPDDYELREWKSMRRGNLFVKADDLTEEDRSWLAGSYDAISFESYHHYIPELAELFRSDEYRNTVSAEEFYQTVMQSGMFGKYENGAIREGNTLWPI